MMDPAKIIAITFTVVGHISFALTFASYAQRDIIRLRMIAVVGLLCGLTYNGWVQSKMTGEDNIWLVLFWLAVFLIQNVFLLVREIRDGLEVSLPADERALLVSTFPTMHSRDWQAMMKLARIETFTKGVTLLEIGQSTDSLQLIARGSAIEQRADLHRACGKGTLWGELTYVMGDDQFNASPVKLLAASDTLVVYTWSYNALRQLASRNLRLHAALNHGFVTSAGLKHGLLWSEAQAQSNRNIAANETLAVV